MMLNYSKCVLYLISLVTANDELVREFVRQEAFVFKKRRDHI